MSQKAQPLQAFPIAPVLATGQTLCFDSAGAVINCAGTGQDGEFQAGFPLPNPRFTDRNDGTAKDNLTGLVWLKNANCTDTVGGINKLSGSLHWYDSLNWSNNLASGSCGLTDGSVVGQWRLPNVKELMSLVDLSMSYPALPDGHPFTNVEGSALYSHYYPSSTTPGYNTQDAFLIYLGSGNKENLIKSTNYPLYPWPVRDDGITSSVLPKTGQTLSYATGDDGALQKGVQWPNPRFTDNSDGTIIDTLTGLMWLQNAGCFGAKVWQVALTDANTLESGACGLTDGSVAGDWHLPNRNELNSLIDFISSSNILPSGHPFTNTISPYLWTSTSVAASPSYAWVTNSVQNKGSLDYFSAWPVRSGQHVKFDAFLISLLPQFGVFPTYSTAPPHLFKLKNSSPSAQNITGITITGTDAPEFVIATGGGNPCSSLTPTLAAGASCTLILGFSPTSSGTKSASLNIAANSTTNSIPLSGTGIKTVYGTVNDQATGSAVSGATVTLNTSTTVTTDVKGNYNFGNLPAATYSINVVKSGYQATSKTGLVVTTTASTKADILLPTVATLNITTTSLPWTSPNVAYSSHVMVAGGTAPYTFSRPYGTLPTGLTLDTTTGTISGTPTGTRTYTFAIGVIDKVLGYSEKEFTLELISPLQITTASLPSGQQGVSYSSSILGTGGKLAYSFSLIGGTLPNGLTLDTNGALSGTPRESGTFNINVRLTESTGVTADKSYTLTLAATDVLTLITTTLPQGYIGTYYSTTLSASGGVLPRTFSVTGTLPTGLSINSSTGILSGTPSAAGLTNLSFIVTDYSYPTGQTASRVIPLRIWSPVNGACGAADGTTIIAAPTTGFCSAGTASTVSGSGPWSWTCSGLSGGTNASCSANIIYVPLHNGDLTGDGKVEIADALMALRIAVGLVPMDIKYLADGDVAPFSGGVPQPDGTIDISDALMILRKCVGLVNW